MSPRAAWRLESLGFTAYDYAGGKMDWLAFGLPYEGDADLAGAHVEQVPTCGMDARLGEVRPQVEQSPDGVAVVTGAGVVLGVLTADVSEADDEAPVAELMREGPTTVRPSEEAEALAHRMGHAGVGLILVTRPDGTLLGGFRGPEAAQG